MYCVIQRRNAKPRQDPDVSFRCIGKIIVTAFSHFIDVQNFCPLNIFSTPPVPKKEGVQTFPRQICMLRMN